MKNRSTPTVDYRLREQRWVKVKLGPRRSDGRGQNDPPMFNRSSASFHVLILLELWFQTRAIAWWGSPETYQYSITIIFLFFFLGWFYPMHVREKKNMPHNYSRLFNPDSHGPWFSMLWPWTIWTSRPSHARSSPTTTSTAARAGTGYPGCTGSATRSAARSTARRKPATLAKGKCVEYVSMHLLCVYLCYLHNVYNVLQCKEIRVM